MENSFIRILVLDIKTKLETKGNRIDDFDILIGATAIVNNIVMVTYNVKHLERLSDIVIENWKIGTH